MQEKAIAEDATVFQYDEVYDDIQNKRNEEKMAKKTADAKKPRYINKLLETAEKRKKEYERRIERQVQKERDAEGEEFKDKESFVTSSYKKKLEEMRAAEEEEKREEYLESIGDVTKQQDLSGFYRHLYSQKHSEAEKSATNAAIKEEPSNEKAEDSKNILNKKKNYRKRKASEEDDKITDNEDKKPDVAHLQSNLDADSDFEIESSDSESETNNKNKSKDSTDKKDDKVPSIEIITESVEIKQEIVKSEDKEDTFDEPEVKTEPAEPKIDIWKKRTVGEKFDEALQRYFERKAMREQAA
jgi:coiled-coil domain-containing protein 55